VLRRTCDSLLYHVGDRNMQHQACYLCALWSEQEMLQVEEFR
jgi:hypothetical protein